MEYTVQPMIWFHTYHDTILVSKNIYRPDVLDIFLALQSFQMFVGCLFHIELLYLLYRTTFYSIKLH